jgi:poly-alpha-2,8 sialosyl sialyltransferase
MKKLKKFFKSPRKFFKDSLWFKNIRIDIHKKYENLFVVSHLGQLNQIEVFIKSKGIENNLLIVLYTMKNKLMPTMIENQYNKLLFEDVVFLKLPNKPNSYNISTLFFIKRIYIKLLKITNPINLYLLSFENHYSLLATYAKNKNINLILLEEGTAVYKKLNPFEINNLILYCKWFIAKILKIDVAFDRFYYFDVIYASFPHLLENKFKAKKYQYFFAYNTNSKMSSETKILINKYKITSKDFIYVNQRYSIDNEEFAKALVYILEQISDLFNVRIFIKFHPKDTPSLIESVEKYILKDSKIILIQENTFVIENILKLLKSKYILGLTSTSLLYASLISPEINSYSIVPWFIKQVTKTDENLVGINIIKEHYEIIKEFKQIKKISSLQDLMQNNIKDTV